MLLRPALLLLSLLATSCAGLEPRTAERAEAVLAGSDGSPRGRATLAGANNSVVLAVNAEGLPAGAHGIHLHAVGRCDAPDFASAGPHWNPTQRKHGRDNPEGAHGGDLPNLQANANGRGRLRFALKAAELAQLFDEDGTALIIHAAADDYRTDPSGNSGGRIACGVIARR